MPRIACLNLPLTLSCGSGTPLLSSPPVKNRRTFMVAVAFVLHITSTLIAESLVLSVDKNYTHASLLFLFCNILNPISHASKCRTIFKEVEIL